MENLRIQKGRTGGRERHDLVLFSGLAQQPRPLAARRALERRGAPIYALLRRARPRAGRLAHLRRHVKARLGSAAGAPRRGDVRAPTGWLGARVRLGRIAGVQAARARRGPNLVQGVALLPA